MGNEKRKKQMEYQAEVKKLCKGMREPLDIDVGILARQVFDTAKYYKRPDIEQRAGLILRDLKRYDLPATWQREKAKILKALMRQMVKSYR